MASAVQRAEGARAVAWRVAARAAWRVDARVVGARVVAQ